MSNSDLYTKMRSIKGKLKEKYDIVIEYKYDFNRRVYAFKKNQSKLITEISEEFLDDFPEESIIERIVKSYDGEKIYNPVPVTNTTVYPASGTIGLSGVDVSGTSTTTYHFTHFKAADNKLFDKYKIDIKPDKHED